MKTGEKDEVKDEVNDKETKQTMENGEMDTSELTKSKSEEHTLQTDEVDKELVQNESVNSTETDGKDEYVDIVPPEASPTPGEEVSEQKEPDKEAAVTEEPPVEVEEDIDDKQEEKEEKGEKEEKEEKERKRSESPENAFGRDMFSGSSLARDLLKRAAEEGLVKLDGEKSDEVEEEEGEVEEKEEGEMGDDDMALATPDQDSDDMELGTPEEPAVEKEEKQPEETEEDPEEESRLGEDWWERARSLLQSRQGFETIDQSRANKDAKKRSGPSTPPTPSTDSSKKGESHRQRWEGSRTASSKHKAQPSRSVPVEYGSANKRGTDSIPPEYGKALRNKEDSGDDDDDVPPEYGQANRHQSAVEDDDEVDDDDVPPEYGKALRQQSNTKSSTLEKAPVSVPQDGQRIPVLGAPTYPVVVPHRPIPPHGDDMDISDGEQEQER